MDTTNCHSRCVYQIYLQSHKFFGYYRMMIDLATMALIKVILKILNVSYYGVLGLHVVFYQCVGGHLHQPVEACAVLGYQFLHRIGSGAIGRRLLGNAIKSVC